MLKQKPTFKRKVSQDEPDVAAALLDSVATIYNGPWKYPLNEQQCIDLAVNPCNYDNAQGEDDAIKHAHANLLNQQFVRNWQDACVDFRDVLKANGDMHIIGFPLPTVDNFDDDESGNLPRKTYSIGQFNFAYKTLIFMMENVCTFNEMGQVKLQLSRAVKAKESNVKKKFHRSVEVNTRKLS